MNAWLETPIFWLWMSFLLFWAFAFNKVRLWVREWLDERILLLSREIEDVTTLHNDAKQALMSAQRRLEQVRDDVAALEERTTHTIQQLKKFSAQELEDAMAFQHRLFEERITGLEQQLAEEMVNEVTERAVARIRERMVHAVSAEQHVFLMNQAVEALTSPERR